MKKTIALFLLFSIFSVPLIPSAFAQAPETNTAVNYFAEGNRLRGGGDCAGAIENYKKAAEHKQFRDGWTFHLAVAECYIALREYDRAIESYARAISASRNEALQAELYRGKGRAYYLKAARAASYDPGLIELARKNLRAAKSLGADTAGLEKDISSLDERQKQYPSGKLEDEAIVKIEENDKAGAKAEAAAGPPAEQKQETEKAREEPVPDKKDRIKKKMAGKIKKKKKKKSSPEKKTVVRTDRDVSPEELKTILKESLRQ